MGFPIGFREGGVGCSWVHRNSWCKGCSRTHYWTKNRIPTKDKGTISLWRCSYRTRCTTTRVQPGTAPDGACLRHLRERPHQAAGPKEWGFSALRILCEGQRRALHKALDGYARKSNAQNLAILDRQSSSCDRREFAARSASDKSLCIRSEAANIRGIAFVWPR